MIFRCLASLSTVLSLTLMPQAAFAVDKTVIITSGTTWSVPADFTSTNTVRCLGGGGGGSGGSSASNSGGAGGSGGSYAEIVNVALTPSSTVNIGIGAGGAGGAAGNIGVKGGAGGDTWFNATSLSNAAANGVTISCGAQGAQQGAVPQTAGAAGSSSSSTGVTKFSGGAGGSPGNFATGAGGGGGAAGPSGAGALGGNTGRSGAAIGGGGGGAPNGGGAGATSPSGLGGAGGAYPGGSGGVGGASPGSPGGGGTGGGGGGGGAGINTVGVAGGGGVGSYPVLWTATVGGATAGPGSGGGGGGVGSSGGTDAPGAAAGGYGGGGGGGACDASPCAAGAIGTPGVIVVTYTAGGGSCSADGSAAAPAGAPQHPSLLSGYTTTPPCAVAGVTYAVGRPQSGLPTLKVPGVDAFPTGFSWHAGNPATKMVRCDNATGSTFDNWDMRGLSLNITQSCSGTVIKNSVFEIQAASCTGNIQLAGPNTTFEYNTVDGGGYSVGTTCSPGAMGEGVYFTATATGTQTYRYNYNFDQVQHFASFGNATVDFRFNLIERCGFFQGTHCNGFQISGNSTGSRVEYNTYISSPGTIDLGATAGTFSSGSPNITNINLGGSGTENSIRVGSAITGAFIPGGATVVSATTVGANTTITMSANATGSGSNNFDIANAYPVGLIIPIRWVSQLAGNLSGADVSNNVIVTTGSPATVSYGIYCAVETGTNANVTLSGNYFDLQGSVGAFYPGGVLCSPRSGSGNFNMRTGASIPIP